FVLSFGKIFMCHLFHFIKKYTFFFISIFIYSQFSLAETLDNQFVIVDRLQVQSDSRSTTLRFIASADVAVQAYAIDQPARIILEWPDVNFQLSPENLPNSVGVIKSLRAGMVSDDRARVVIE
ncbi:MAG: AMIN domain-containing protein, partial [Dolichospermum sp.]